jgi:hypothetical protein
MILLIFIEETLLVMQKHIVCHITVRSVTEDWQPRHCGITVVQ